MDLIGKRKDEIGDAEEGIGLDYKRRGKEMRSVDEERSRGEKRWNRQELN